MISLMKKARKVTILHLKCDYSQLSLILEREAVSKILVYIVSIRIALWEFQVSLVKCNQRQ